MLLQSKQAVYVKINYLESVKNKFMMTITRDSYVTVSCKQYVPDSPLDLKLY
jgi:hypothetical protein